MKKIYGTRIHTQNPRKVKNTLEKSAQLFVHFETDPENFYIEGLPPSYWMRLRAIPTTTTFPAYGIQIEDHVSWYKREKIRDLWYQKLELGKRKKQEDNFTVKIYKTIAKKY